MALDKDGQLGSSQGGAGAVDFDELNDTPVDKVGSENKLVTVNATATALEYTDPPAGVSINFHGGYIFDGASTGDADPGAGKFRLNNVDPLLATFAFVSDVQQGGPDFSDTLVDIALDDNISIMQRDVIGRANSYSMTGPAVEATGYFKLPIVSTSVGDTGSILDLQACVIWVDPRGQINSNTLSIDRIAITEVTVPGEVAIDDPPGTGFTYSTTAGKAIFIGADSLRTVVNFPATNNVPISGSLNADLIILTVNISGAIEQYDVRLTPSLRRTTAQLGAIVRQPTGELIGGFDSGQIEFQVLNKIADLANAIGPFASRDVRVDTSGVADTTFKLFGGTAFSYDSTQNILDPSGVIVSTLNIANFQVYLPDGTLESVEYVGDDSNTALIPSLFQPTPLLPVSAALATIPGGPNQATITIMFWQPGSVPPTLRLVPGQTIFANLTDAINGLETYAPVISSRVSATAIPLGGVIAIKGATDFTDTTQAMFFRPTAITGGGAGTVAPNTQEIYLNSSTQPQYLINNVQNDMQVQDGVNNLLKILWQYNNFAGESQWRMTSSGLTITGGTEPNLTGVENIGGNATIEPDNKTLRIPAGNGWITNFRDDARLGTRVQAVWIETLLTIPDGTLSTDDATYVFHNGTTFDTQATAPTLAERMENVFIAATINDTDTVTIAVVLPDYRLTGTTAQVFNELLERIGPLADGGLMSKASSGGDLAFQIAEINVFVAWANAATDRDDMSDITYAAVDPATFAYMLRDGDYAPAFTQLDPTIYDDGSATAQPVPNPTRNATIQYVWQLITGDHIVTLGQTVYGSLTAAVDALQADRASRVLPPVLTTPLALEVGAWVMQKDTTDLNDTSKAQPLTFLNRNGVAVGITNFLAATDTPTTYAGAAGQVVGVNADETALVFLPALTTTGSVAPGGTLVLAHNLNTADVMLSGTYIDGAGDSREIGGYPPVITQIAPLTDLGTAGNLSESVQCTPQPFNDRVGVVFRDSASGVYRYRSVSNIGGISANVAISGASVNLSCDIAPIAAGAICVFQDNSGEGAAAILDGVQTVTTSEFVWRAATTSNIRCHELSDGNIVIIYATAVATTIEAQIMDSTGALVGGAFTVTVSGNGTHYAVGCTDGNIVFLYGDNVTGELAYRVQSNDLVTQIVTETILVGADIDYEQIQGVARDEHAVFMYQDSTNGDVRYLVEIETSGDVTGFSTVDPANPGTVSTVNDIGLTIFDRIELGKTWVGANGWMYFQIGATDPVIIVTETVDQPRVCAFPGLRRFALTGSFSTTGAGRYQLSLYEVANIVIKATDLNTATLTNHTAETLTITLNASR